MENSFKLDIHRATADEQEIIGNLLQLYIYEFSSSEGIDVESDGRFSWDGLEDYWNDTTLHPFLFTVDSKTAGFALIQKVSVVSGDPNVWDMEDFFVMSKYRRRGVGKSVMQQLWTKFIGPWEIRVLVSNDRAFGFWSHVIASQCNERIKPIMTLVNGRSYYVFSFDVGVKYSD